MQGYHQRYRGIFFRLTKQLHIQAISPNKQLLDALEYIQQTQYGSAHLDEELDLDFATPRWRSLIRQKVEGEWKLEKTYLQACVFSCIADGLRNGDLYVSGSEQFADYRTQLLDWSEYKPLLDDYCRAIEIPNKATDFIKGLRKKLKTLAEKVDGMQINDGSSTSMLRAIPIYGVYPNG